MEIFYASENILCDAGGRIGFSTVNNRTQGDAQWREFDFIAV